MPSAVAVVAMKMYAATAMTDNCSSSRFNPFLAVLVGTLTLLG